MTIFRYVAISLSVLFFGSQFSACDESTTSDKEENQQDEILEFIWIPKELGNRVFETGRDGAFAKADQLTEEGPYKIEVTYAGPESATDVQGQVELIRKGITWNVSGIAISCNTPDGLEEAINEAAAAGIPVMTFDSDSPDSDRFTYLGVDNEEGGALAARILGESMSDTESSTVALVSGVQGAANLEARISGFQDELQERFPDFEIVDTVYCDDDENLAASKIEELLTTYPDLGGLFFVGLWPLFVCEDTDCSEEMPLWDAAAKSGDVKTVVFDTLAFQLPFVEEGMVAGLVGQKYWGWGFDAIQMLYERVVEDQSFSEWTNSGIDVVCPNNVEEMDQMWENVDFTSPLSPCEINGETID